jgi:hypothetical protein
MQGQEMAQNIIRRIESGRKLNFLAADIRLTRYNKRRGKDYEYANDND